MEDEEDGRSDETEGSKTQDTVEEEYQVWVEGSVWIGIRVVDVASELGRGEDDDEQSVAEEPEEDKSRAERSVIIVLLRLEIFDNLLFRLVLQLHYHLFIVSINVVDASRECQFSNLNTFSILFKCNGAEILGRAIVTLCTPRHVVRVTSKRRAC